MTDEEWEENVKHMNEVARGYLDEKEPKVLLRRVFRSHKEAEDCTDDWRRQRIRGVRRTVQQDEGHLRTRIVVEGVVPTSRFMRDESLHPFRAASAGHLRGERT